MGTTYLQFPSEIIIVNFPYYLADVSELNLANKADKERIIQVMHNILNNAIKYAEGGEITIETNLQNVQNEMSLNDGPARRELVISIRDTEPGIDPEIFPRLFTRFTTRSDQGTGLDLFISKGIIEAHGGKIWANNNDKGAVFYFSLPLAAT